MIMSECRNCKRSVRENCRGIQYDYCFWWFHLKCSALSVKEYNYFATTHDLWLCLHCHNEIFRFNSVVFRRLIRNTVSSIDVTLFILLLVSYIYIFFFILTLDLCRASLKTTLCDVGSLLKDRRP